MSSQDSRYQLETDEVFEGKYRIVRELGRGGFGVIYLAHQMSMDRPVALKILKPDVGKHDPNARERFLREVKIISKLRHPNTITIHDYGETLEGIVYMVLEYVEGTTLKSVLKHQGPRQPMEALGFARQIARSLDEAHQHGVIHRDLKPANIMLTDLEGKADFVKVLDFGVARLRGNEDVDMTQAAAGEGERALIGTPRYMSPEQVRGEDLTGASDLYGLGLLLYEMLIGQPAVEGTTAMSLISQQISDNPLPLDGLDRLHPRLQDLIRRATDKELDSRFRSGADFADAIDQTAHRISAENAADPEQNRRQFFATSGQFSAVSASGTGPAVSASGEATGREPDDAIPFDDASAPGFEVDHSTSRSAGLTAESDGLDLDTDGIELDTDAPDLDSEALADPPRSTAGDNASSPSPESSSVFVDPRLDDQSRLLGIPTSELPDAPGLDDSPFSDILDTDDPVDDDTSTSDDDAMAAPRHEEDDESALHFGFIVAKLCVFATLAAIAVYTTFIVIGAATGIYLSGTLQFGAALVVGLAIPLFTALAESSQKERFKVVERLRNRLGRVFLGTLFFSMAAIFVVSFALPAPVVSELRTNSDWMFHTDPGFPEAPAAVELNNGLSSMTANVIQKATIDLGWFGVYGGEDWTEPESDDGRDDVVVPFDPDSTRPASSDDEPEDDVAEEDDEVIDDDDEPTPAQEPVERQPSPDDTDRGTADDAEEPEAADDEEPDDGDYATW